MRTWFQRSVTLRALRLSFLALVGAFSLAAWAGSASAQDERPEVYRIRIDGPITTVTTDYLERTLGEAEEAGAEAFLIELDTPGGSVEQMLSIGSRMLNSETPILIWVGPQGAQAASAGTFLVLAAHAAGMAPRTTIGAASPVGPGGEDLPETVTRKITEDLAATARNYAERRGDDAVDWAQEAVRDAASATAEEALEKGVIDLIADSSDEMVEALDGRGLVVAGEERVVALEDARFVDVPTNSAEDLLGLLASPALALILLTLGVNAILTELSNPGGYVAGLIGILALAAGLYSLGVLEANWIGLVFMAVAFLLFALDIKTPSMGLFTLGGVILFVAGAAVLFAGGEYGIPWATIGSLALATGLFFYLVVRAAMRAFRRQPTTGFEGLVGARAEVKRAIGLGQTGTVLVAGERWDAELADDASEAALEPGDEAEVAGNEGYRLQVRPMQESDSE